MKDEIKLKLAILITCITWFGAFIYLVQRKHVKTLNINPYEISKDFEKMEELVTIKTK